MSFARLLPLAVMAISLQAADTRSEIAGIIDVMYRAAAAHDADAYAKFLAADFHAISHGEVRDRQQDVTAIRNGSFNAGEIKVEEVSTSVYGDTVLHIRNESWTTSTGNSNRLRHARLHKTDRFLRLAFFSHSDVLPAR